MYTESLCPDCIEFITNSLKPAINAKDINLIAEFNIYPYGNAKQTFSEERWQFKCQHGSQECFGNLLQNCVINKTNTQTGINFIICFEENIKKFGKDIEKTGEHCSNDFSLNFGELKDCMYGDLGKNIQHEVADTTDALNPQHNYVPWIVVNGNHDENAEAEIATNMLSYICRNYKGIAVVEGCNTKQNSGKNFLKKP